MIKENKKGITLIALVITIIVLLVLAGVSLTLVLGDNGVINKAQNATIETRNAEEKEKIEMAVAAARAAGNGALTTEKLNTELDKVFNNGKEVEESKISRLPKEYQEVEYIESTGTQNINTNLIPKATLNGEFEIMRTGSGYPFGSTNSQSKDYWGMNFFSGTKTFECYFGTGTYPKVSHWDDNIIYKISIIDKKFYCDDDLLCDFNEINNNYSFNTNKPIYLFGLNYPGGEYGGYRFYKAKFWDETKTLMDFIPCYSTTTVTDVNGNQCPKGTIGLYDLIEGKFYTNQGTGTFLKGKDIVTSEVQEWSYEIDENKKYIISNDGKVEQIITEEKDNSLPKEYQQVGYIESTGAQYIDTKLDKITKKIQIKMIFSISKIKEYQNLFCCRSGAFNSRSLFIYYLNGFRNDQNTNQNIINKNLKLDQIYEIDSTQTYFKLDDSILEQYDNNSGLDLEYAFTLLNCNNYNDFSTMSNTFGFEGKIYDCKIYDNNILKRDFIPCYSTKNVTDVNGKQCSANTKGLYDLVEGKFYTNQGSGNDFVAGPDV